MILLKDRRLDKNKFTNNANPTSKSARRHGDLLDPSVEIDCTTRLIRL